MLKNKSNPQVVPSLEGLFIADVAVGCEHVLALTSTGDVYAWGCNSEGQVNAPPPSMSLSEDAAFARPPTSLLKHPVLSPRDL